MKIQAIHLKHSLEPLLKPFGFKGAETSHLWQTHARVSLDDGHQGYGQAVQSAIWADARVYARLVETSALAPDMAMFLLTNEASRHLLGQSFTDPLETLQSLLDDTHAYATVMTQQPDLQKSFTLNALVSLDFALWQLWARAHEVKDFDVIFERFSHATPERQDRVALIPLIHYNTSDAEVAAQLEEGACVLKIKIGHRAPEDCSDSEMVERDLVQIRRVHKIAKHYRTDETKTGRVMYYLDANGQYREEASFLSFVAGLYKLGVMEQILMVEEPYEIARGFAVRDLPFPVVADESVEDLEGIYEMVDKRGYSVLALKPIAKTLSQSLLLYRAAAARGIACFCADLTVPPNMVDWNLNVAARLPVLPDLNVAVVESNGAQNYKNWASLLATYRCAHCYPMEIHKGIFDLEGFFERDDFLTYAES